MMILKRGIIAFAIIYIGAAIEFAGKGGAIDIVSAFVYNGNNYELLSVTPIADSEGQFSILLKTPTSTQKYIWPR